MFPPGWLSRATMPLATGSPTFAKTIGIFQDGGVAVQFGESAAHGFPDQLVIVDHQEFHRHGSSGISDDSKGILSADAMLPAWRFSDGFRAASHHEPKRLARRRSASFYDRERWNQTFVGLPLALLLHHKPLFSWVILPRARHASFERMNTLDQFIEWGEAAIIGEPQIDTCCTPWRCTISETSPRCGQRDRSRNGRPAEDPRLPTRNGGGAWPRSGAR